MREDPGKRGDESTASFISNNDADQSGKLEQLRRTMASIPDRSDGTEPATPSVMPRPVDEPESTPIVAIAQSTLRMLPVPISDLLPRGGLAPGTVVSVSGANSVLTGLLASVTADGGHAVSERPLWESLQRPNKVRTCRRSS